MKMTGRFKLSILFVFTTFITSLALADGERLAKDRPAAFQNECGSCHVAFLPSFLTAAEWQRIMGQLANHYGDNATLDEQNRQTIEQFLVRQAGRFAVGQNSGTEQSLPRLTTANWFKRKHHEVSSADWNHANVKSPANCGACHTRANEGSYREREIIMPDGRTWEDD